MSSDREHNESTESNYSPQQRKTFYRKFLGKTRTLQESVDHRTIGALRDIMINADTISADEQEAQKVDRPDEILLDSEVMSVTSDVLKRCTDTLIRDSSPYNHGEFADKILSYIQLRPDTVLDEPHWPILADDVLKCINVTPHYSYLLGTLKPLEKKPPVKRKHAPRDAQAATKRPENVQAVDKVEDGVEETVKKIKVLVTHYYKNNEEPLDLFKLILNPNDFGRTVENMLHVSFLVRDGHFKLEADKEKLIIKPSTKEALAKAKKKGNDANVQNVMSLNAEQWQSLKKSYKMTEPMINFGTSGRT